MTEKGTRIAIPTQAQTALRTLESAGFEAWVVGGFVRDSLMGENPGDLDIAASSHWQQTRDAFMAAGFSVYETGTKHGTVTVDVDGTPIEITTYRTDGSYSDGRHPDSVAFVESIEEDLARRDFTMNAIAYHPDRGVCDPYGGQEDIENGIIRSVGDPKRRFSEDKLRILRAVRFSAQLGFEIDGETREAMEELAAGLTQVAVERQVKELEKILCSNNAGSCLMRNILVLEQAIPELAEMKGFDQRTPFHCYDVLEHTAHVVDLVEPHPLLRWAALLHDVGKPETFTIDENGQGHFKKHPEASERIARRIAKRLKMPRSMTNDMLTLIALHDEPVIPKNAPVRHAIHSLGDRPEMLRDLISLKRADAIARTKLYSMPRVRTAEILAGILDDVIAKNEPYALTHLAITGKDLIEAGIEPGPQIGRILDECLSAVIDGKAGNTRSDLTSLALEIAREESTPGL